jgi:hypothetical protein
MAISDTDFSKRYRIECHIFDGMGEDDQYDYYADSLEEAEAVVLEEYDEFEDGSLHVGPEIIDQRPEERVLRCTA